MSASVGSGKRLAEAERALTEAQQDLDEARFEGERVAAGLRRSTSGCARSGCLPNAGLSRSLKAPGG